jgi:hypothetical protein
VSDRALTNAEVIARIAELVAPTKRTSQKVETVIETTVEAVMFAIANPTLSATEIARHLGRRKGVVLKAVAAVREAEATGYPSATVVAPSARFPLRGNRPDDVGPDCAGGEEAA